jgi:hypothetical protein
MSPHEAQVCIQWTFPTYLVRTYPWGFRNKATLLYGFVFFETAERLAKRSGSD